MRIGTSSAKNQPRGHFSCYILRFQNKCVILPAEQINTIKKVSIKMKVIVDNKIPYIREAIEQLADQVVYLPGSKITAAEVKDADALIIRTRTRCDQQLLEGSQVRFIATATIGYDHIDANYCREAGIAWSNAPGCNAASVAQYVQSCLLLLEREKGMKLEGRTLGIVGVGHVGRLVAEVARRWGMRVLLNDPPRAAAEGGNDFCSLQQLTEESDVITFHVPLQRTGSYPTFHLAHTDFFHSLQRKPVVINTSRGEVVDTQAIKEALSKRIISDAILDVWENEPSIDLDLIHHIYIGTPHIAGYSADGKANATRQALDALCRHFQLEGHYPIPPPPPTQPLIQAATLPDALLQIYNPHTDSQALKEHPELFEQLRGNYPLRREEGAYRISLNDVTEKNAE